MSLTEKQKRELVSTPDNVVEALMLIAWLKDITEGQEPDSQVPGEAIDDMHNYFDQEFDNEKEEVLLQFIKRVAANLENGSKSGLHITQRIQMEFTLERAIYLAHQWKMTDEIIMDATRILRSSTQVMEKAEQSS